MESEQASSCCVRADLERRWTFSQFGRRRGCESKIHINSLTLLFVFSCSFRQSNVTFFSLRLMHVAFTDFEACLFSSQPAFI